MKETLKQQEST